jgi:hypothetical protein
VCFLAISCLRRSTDILADSLRTRTQAVNLERIGSPSTSRRSRNENYLTVTDVAPDYYRDSFGDFLDKHSYGWDFNRRKLQSTWSDVCGQYCIFYLSHRARGQRMNTIVQSFDNNTMLNDAKVFQFVKNHFKVIVKQINNLNEFSAKMIQ